MFNKLKKPNGITLIALIISIIVLLILAGVAISVAVGENGVLTQAKSSIKKNKQATVLEEMTMAWGGLKTDYHAKWAQNSGVNFSNVVSNVLLQRYLVEKGTVNNIEDNQDGTYIIDYTANDKEESRYLFLAKEDGTVEFLDGIVLTPGNMELELLVNGAGEVTSTSRTIKANLNNIEGQVNWTIEKGSDIVELSSISGEIITVSSKYSEELSEVTEKEAKIRATCGEYNAVCYVTVKRKTPIERIDSITGETKINLNDEIPITILTAEVYPENATENVLIWESSDEEKAKVTNVDGKSATITGINEGTVTITVRNQKGTVSKSIEIKVQNPVTVTYMVDDTTYATRQTNLGTAVTNWPSNPSKSGCTFVGWFDETTEGNEYTNSSVINEDITLYAKFVVTLTLNANEGTFANSQTTVTITGNYGEEIQVPNVTKSGSKLFGWYTNTSGGTQIYDSRQKIILTTGGTLYAQWWSNPYSSFLGAPLNIDKYGYLVSGYTAKNYTGKWRLFYQDIDNTYIIADMTSKTTWGSDATETKYPNGSYASQVCKNMHTKLVASDKVFISSYNYSNSRFMIFMNDISNNSIWSTDYKDSKGLATYAIGSPSIELFLSSLKAIKPEIDYSLSVRKAYGSGKSYGYSGTFENNWWSGYHGIYSCESSNSSGYWYLSSPYYYSYSGSINVNYQNGSGQIHQQYYGNYPVRPIVCIPTEKFNNSCSLRND